MANYIPYDKQLNDRRWWLTRKVILLRDNNQCTRCGSNHILQVHHTYYESGLMAWEYPHESLVTLCKKCHEVEHGKLTPMTRSHHTQHISLVFRDILQNMLNIDKNG